MSIIRLEDSLINLPELFDKVPEKVVDSRQFRRR